jgi:hypothetical protein
MRLAMMVVTTLVMRLAMLVVTTFVGALLAHELVSARVLSFLSSGPGGCGDVQAGTRGCGVDVTGAACQRGVVVCGAARAQGEGDESDERCGVKTAHIAGLK